MAFGWNIGLTKGTDCTGPKPEGPAIGSDSIGLVMPLLLATRPLDTDVHVDVVVAMPPKLLLPFADDKPFPLPCPTIDSLRNAIADDVDGGACVSVAKLPDELSADDVVTGDEFNECEFIVILIPEQNQEK